MPVDDQTQTTTTYNQEDKATNTNSTYDQLLEHFSEELVEHFKNSFELFSEEWTEIKPLGKVKRTFKSLKIGYSVHLLEVDTFEFENNLITSYFYEKDGDELLIVDLREEVILTDGKALKHPEEKTQDRQDYTTFKKQKIKVDEAETIVVLKRKRIKNEQKNYEHHDEIEIYIKGEEKYLLVKEHFQNLNN